MRIGIDARMVDNTGVGRYLRNLLLNLARLDADHEYIVFMNHDNSRVVNQENFHFATLPLHLPLYSFREHYWLPKAIWSQQLDVMHYPNFAVPLKLFSPNVITVHDLIYYLYPEECPSRPAHYYVRFMMRHVTKHADLLITDSEYSKQDLMIHFQVPSEKIEVILPAADEQCCPPKSTQLPPSIKEKYGITQPYILYVGKHHRYKNIQALIQAFNCLQDLRESIQLVIAGKRDPRQMELYNMARSLECSPQIVFTDFVPEEELFTLYQHARVFVFPSLYEGFGLPPLEAMACGVPVISSNAASLPEVVGDAAMQVDPRDHSALATAIHKVLTDLTFRESMREQGLQRAQQFSWERAARQLLSIYERCGNQRTGIGNRVKSR